MLRINRVLLDRLIEDFVIAAACATDTRGLLVYFRPTPQQAEAAILGALSILAPHGGPCTASDVQFIEGFGPNAVSFPTHVPTPTVAPRRSQAIRGPTGGDAPVEE